MEKQIFMGKRLKTEPDLHPPFNVYFWKGESTTTWASSHILFL